ncbi:MAG: 2,3-bisphosphoglycerate-independent phosphoglycerate mutase [Oligoflexales bacterium]|nr:2,3-bisphosphoglycerate-independent phosphoglycerate mutase [Oligoflexales bacterium]
MCSLNQEEFVGKERRKVLTVVMDGVGVRDDEFGNAFKAAHTPVLDYLKTVSLYRTLKAHGPAVGLPSDDDMGNSEVGHNAFGAGRVFDQGAKLVQNAIKSGEIFQGKSWKTILNTLKSSQGALHLIGLLSDGNVHSHEAHLYSLLIQAKKDGIKKVRIHVLLDGRDVPEKSAEVYAKRLEEKVEELSSSQFDIKIASGGGRMVVTMDRYEADWEIVRRGWEAHVEGDAPHYFKSLSQAIAYFREDDSLTDQYLPAFVIKDGQGPVGTVSDGDCVVLFNFRGDRAIEISRAFTEESLNKFKRKRFPKIFFAGMMEYDGDLHIPKDYLVAPPAISDTLSEYLVSHGVKQFACSETQKFGHVTFFWNGNRSGKFSDDLEEYLEIPSDVIAFNLKPWMKSYEITEALIQRIRKGSFEYLRINFPNGDMVGHTGDLDAAIAAMSCIDIMIGKIFDVCCETNTILMITADHGNCDEMFDLKKVKNKNIPWLAWPVSGRPEPKTSHTLNPVPFYVFDPIGGETLKMADLKEASIANIAATVIELLGLPPKDNYFPTLVKRLS